MINVITAVEMAHARDIDPKRFRAALRQARLPWHAHNARWVVRIGSPEHKDMERVMAALGR
jgi:hypothetical protein